MSERLLDWEFPGPWPYEATVVARDDPEGVGRVKVTIPGEVDETGWLMPFGNPAAGDAQRGALIVPPLHADVLVFYPGGDRENGRYIASNYGKPLVNGTPTSEVPEGTHVSGTDDGDNIVWLDKRVRIEVDSREASTGVRVSDVETGTALELDLDMAARVLRVSTDIGIVLRSQGIVRIEGSTILIGGRPVAPSTEPI